MTVCIQYSQPASGQNDTEIFGFDVAVTRFLSAYFRHSHTPQFLCRPTDIPSFKHFKKLAAQEGVDAKNRCVGLDPRHPDKNLQGLSCLFRPDPLIADLIWRRQQVKGPGFATCGLVHTMSGERVAQAVGNLCFAPSESTDALICPSVAIRDAVRRLWEIQSDYIRHRFGGTFSCPVQTPIIPLGIDTQDFADKTSPACRQTQRQSLNIEDDEIIVLFVGRLSFATKAHPLPLLMAVDRAARLSACKVRLVLYGYFKPKDMEPLFKNLAKDMAKNMRVDFVTNDDPRFPKGLWAAADIFTSLSDNVQESFGLTPIEAMACGLPSVISDWDGYREGVRPNVDGFLVPVYTPPPSAGMDIAQMYYNEDNYGVALAGASQSTGVNIEEATKAYALLMSNAELRKTFGLNAKLRAQNVFDWKHIIKAYDELWRDLAAQRQASPPSKPVPDSWPALHPGYINPWEMFKSFPTAHLSPDDLLRIALDAEDIATIMSHDINYFVPQLLLSKEQMIELIELIRRAQRARIADVLAAFPADGHDLLWRCIGWLLKCGICSLERTTP